MPTCFRASHLTEPSKPIYCRYEMDDVDDIKTHQNFIARWREALPPLIPNYHCLYCPSPHKTSVKKKN